MAIPSFIPFVQAGSVGPRSGPDETLVGDRLWTSGQFLESPDNLVGPMSIFISNVFICWFEYLYKLVNVIKKMFNTVKI